MPLSPKDPVRTYRYGEVLGALGRAFDADEQGLAAIKGRLKGYQKDGLVPSAPGRGKEIKYTVADVYDWGLALTLAQFGLSPRIIIKVVKIGTFAKQFLPEMNRRAGEHADHRLYLFYFPSLFYDFSPVDAEPMTYVTSWSDRFELDLQGLLQTKHPFGVADLTALRHKIDDGLRAEG